MTGSGSRSRKVHAWFPFYVDYNGNQTMCGSKSQNVTMDEKEITCNRCLKSIRCK